MYLWDLGGELASLSHHEDRSSRGMTALGAVVRIARWFVSVPRTSCVRIDKLAGCGGSRL